MYKSLFQSILQGKFLEGLGCRKQDSLLEVLYLPENNICFQRKYRAEILIKSYVVVSLWKKCGCSLLPEWDTFPDFSHFNGSCEFSACLETRLNLFFSFVLETVAVLSFLGKFIKKIISLSGRKLSLERMMQQSSRVN